MIGALTAAPPLAVAQQAYLHEASQMQALSFAVHIPLVCFGIALPSMVLFVECVAGTRRAETFESGNGLRQTAMGIGDACLP